MVRTLLRGHVFGGVGAQGFERLQGLQAGARRKGQQLLAALHVFGQLLEGGGVGFGQGFAHLFVVATQGLEGVFGYAALQRLQVGQAQQGVAHLQVVVQKAQRAAFFKALQPQGGARQFDGHGVAVHAKDAAAHHFAQGVAVSLGGDGAFGRAQLGQLFGQAAGGGQQKVAAATGGVDHADGQQGIDRLGRVLRQALGNDGVERAADELLHQAVGGVVAAGEFAVVACGASFARQADKAEAAGVQVHLGHQLQQAFVHAAEFFGAHVAVVDGGQRATAGGGGPAQGVHGGQQVGVGELGGIQVRALVRGKQAAQGGQPQARLALAQAVEDDFDGLPQVVKPGAGTAAQGQVAQAGQGVAAGVGLGGGGFGAGGGGVGLCFFSRGLGGDEAALFHAEGEDAAVDEAQQLGKVVLRAQAAALQGLAQGVVGGVLHKALAQGEQRLRDARAQAVAHAGAFFLPGFAPGFPGDGGWRCIGVGALPCAAAQQPGTAGVQQAPGKGKFGQALAGQQVLQIKLKVAGAGERGGVAQQAQGFAVAHQRPLVRGAGVEQFLRQLKGGFFAAAAAGDGKACVGLVQPQGVGCHHDGQAGARVTRTGCAGPVGDGVVARLAALPQGDAAAGAHAGVGQGVAQQFGDEAGGGVLGVVIRAFQQRGKAAPLGAGNLKGAADFVFELQALGQAVVGLGLQAGAAMGGLGQHVGQEQAAFEPQGGQVEGGGVAANGFHGRGAAQRARWADTVGRFRYSGAILTCLVRLLERRRRTMQTWQIQTAKARFSELVKQAAEDGPQEITLHGKPVAVVLSREAFERLSGGGAPSLVEFMRRSPLHGLDELALERDRSPTREVEL